MNWEDSEMFSTLKLRYLQYMAPAARTMAAAVAKTPAAPAKAAPKPAKAKAKPPKEEVKRWEDLTKAGEKKDLSQGMPDTYDPKYVESAWYAWWEQRKFFNSDQKEAKAIRDGDSKRKQFTMVIPPPNITGALHLGHALMLSIEDCIVRWKRMQGFEVEWVPGQDHAGISTQTVVENMLWR